MKKIFRILFVSLFFVTATVSASAYVHPVSDSARDEARAAQMLVRISEIQAMDKTSLTASEKTDLKKELTKMNKEAKGLSSRVTISVAAIIIAVLLLILILN